MKRIMSYFSAFAMSTIGCATARGEAEKTVDQVDIKRFMGDWYVIANIPTYFEEDACNAIEGYTWNEAESRIDVNYRHHEKTPEGPLKSYPQKAWIYNETSKAEWRVQPIWPLKFAYLIVDLAPDYSWTVIGVPNRKHIWIMARKPAMDPKVFSSLKEKFAQRGYEMEKLRVIPQKW